MFRTVPLSHYHVFFTVHTAMVQVDQNDWSGFEVDYIHKYGEQNYKF